LRSHGRGGGRGQAEILIKPVALAREPFVSDGADIGKDGVFGEFGEAGLFGRGGFRGLLFGLSLGGGFRGGRFAFGLRLGGGGFTLRLGLGGGRLALGFGLGGGQRPGFGGRGGLQAVVFCGQALGGRSVARAVGIRDRSEEHTSELQSRENLVCRLLLEKKNI